MEGDMNIYYEDYSLEGEIRNFIKVWLSVVVSLCYCSLAAKFVPKGLPRLLAFIPVICLFLFLPLNLHSMHLGGTTAFFIAWLAVFKLLSLAFDKGPLSDPSLSLPRFVAIGCLPIKIQKQNPVESPKTQHGYNNASPPNGHRGGGGKNPLPGTAGKKGHKSIWNYALKAVLLALFFRAYDYSDSIHPKIILVIYCLHIYFMLEIMLVMVAALARAALGLQLEPQFDEPYLSTSLQDFWGRRWNLMVSRTLRPTVYDPVLSISTRIVGRKWASLPAVLATFLASALMHEVIFYYLGRTRPTWEITWFFLLHGVCLVAEILVKKMVKGRCQLPPVISTPLTIAFVLATGYWLFFPQLLRCKGVERAVEEYNLLGACVRDIAGEAVKLRHFNSTRL